METTKQERLLIIKAMISSDVIGSQDELLSLLKRRGINTTQATLSRDMKELKIAKTHSVDGSYVYKLPTQPRPKSELLDSLLVRKGFVSFQFSGQLGVIKTRPGYASSIASDIDSQIAHEIIGTIAGDDTILIVPREGINRDQIVDILSVVIPNVKDNII